MRIYGLAGGPQLKAGERTWEEFILNQDKQTLQFSLNVDNVTNNRIAQRVYNAHNYSTVYMDNDEVLAGFDS